MTPTKKPTNTDEEQDKKKTVKKTAAKKTAAKKTSAEKKPAAKKTTGAKKTAAPKKPAAKKTTGSKKSVKKEVQDTKAATAEETVQLQAQAQIAAPQPELKEQEIQQEQKKPEEPKVPETPKQPVEAQSETSFSQSAPKTQETPTSVEQTPKQEFKQENKPAPQADNRPHGDHSNRHDHKRHEDKPAQPQKTDEKIIKILGQPTIKELAEKMDIKINDFIKKLMGMGIFATINQRLEQDMIELVVAECGFKAEIIHEFAEDKIAAEDSEQEDPAHLKPRAPVVTIMGHVDHGKTSLLDAIRHSNVVAGEFGAITQHIGAYRVKTPRGYISFLDTPGHEAFTAMRARGAQATDIVVLVVSATDGIMPQTIEAINHAQSAGAPIIVAINKIDLPGANPDKVKQELANRGLIPEEWQGNTIYVEISAKKRINIDKLLEMISLQAEMMELKANPDRRGVGVILESKRDNKRGVVATVLVQKGTMRVGDPFIVGTNYGKIRALIDEHGKRLPCAGPSVPAEVLGINGEPPAVGDTLFVTESEKEAKHIAEKRKLAHKEEKLAHQKHVSLTSLKSDIDGKKVKELAIILKADVHGSIEAIKDAILRTPTEEVQVKIIHSGAGNVNESDILLAKASNAVIIAFNVDSDTKAAEEAEKEGIESRKYNIIF